MITIKARGDTVIGQIVCAHCGRTAQVMSDSEEKITDYMEKTGWINEGVETYCNRLCEVKDRLSKGKKL